MSDDEDLNAYSMQPPSFYGHHFNHRQKFSKKYSKLLLTDISSELGCIGLLCYHWEYHYSLPEDLLGQIRCQLSCGWYVSKKQVI